MTALAGVAWCLAAFVAAAALARHLIAWTRQRGMIDRPHRRRLHTRPTPRGGGLAIIAVAGVAAVVAAWQLPDHVGPISAATLPAVAVALIGWWDDVALVEPVLCPWGEDPSVRVGCASGASPYFL